MLVIFVGPPGAGKGTQAGRLAKHLGVPHCSTGEMFRNAYEHKSEVGLKAKGFMDSGLLVPDKMVQRIVEQRLVQNDCDNGCVMDGFPRTLTQAQDFDVWTKDHYVPVAKVIEFRVDQETLLSRLDSRGRQDDDRKIIEERFQQYEKLTTPILGYYKEHGILETVSGIGDIDEVFERITTAVNS